MADDWQSQHFRQGVISKISDAIQNSTADPQKEAQAMENHIFKKARNREDYLGLVAKLFIHMRDMRPGKSQNQNLEMQDPINALQNLASQGTRNSQMMSMSNQNNQISSTSVIGGNVAASNLLQTLTQRPPQQLQNMHGIRGQMNVAMGGNITQNNIGSNAISNQLGNAIGNINPSVNINMNQISNQNNQMGNCAPGQLNQIPANQIQMNTNLQGQPINTMNAVSSLPINQINQNQLNMGLGHPPLNQIMGRMNANSNVNVVSNSINQNNLANQLNVPAGMPNQPNLNQGGVVNQNAHVVMVQNSNQINQTVNNNGNIFQNNRNVGQNQFLRQSPSPNVSSPAGLTQTHQSSQMIPSPALVPSSSPQMSSILAGSQRSALRQSPNAPLNTPGQVTGSSPFNAQEDQMYREKYKQLTKYIEPLKRMVAKIGNDDVEKIMKMNKLLEILCNPNQRIPLETLLKCETALEKMDFKSYLFVPSSNQLGSSLFEAVNSTLQNPTKNHTLQRTFRPCLEALFGTDIKCFPSAVKVSKPNIEDENAVPHVLQGEIARLDQKFKVSLDVSSQNNNKTIKLICCLDDKRLPCVPPVSINIPEQYPMSAPSCSLSQQEYHATPFLIAVQNAFIARISKLPKCYSLSHLLDTWEMSVRQACSPNTISPSKFTSLLGV